MSEQSDNFGNYFGRLILEPLSDGRLMRVVEHFGFRDAEGQQWPVFPEAKIDGASIPQALWSLVGGPFEGKYRNASVIHDYYCDLRTRPWQAVHRMFYAGMRASGVSVTLAKVMYAAVYFAGPRWSEATTDNVNLPRPVDSNIHYSVKVTPFHQGVIAAVDVNGQSAIDLLGNGNWKWAEGHETRLNLQQLQELIETNHPSLSEIDAAIDEAVNLLEPPFHDEKRTHTLHQPTKE